VLTTPFKAQWKTVEAVSKLFVETAPTKDLTTEGIEDNEEEVLVIPIKAL
jgi:hypothetical protein